MYCLQWLIPVLLMPKPMVHPSMMFSHALLMFFYLLSFFFERRPCVICSFVFLLALFMLCYNDQDSCLLWPTCRTSPENEESCSATWHQ
ncbi:hypothetical protein D918_03289 [Trichuris suis]|nr:hypothetical protein D918_03289 [Trichuris suis]